MKRLKLEAFKAKNIDKKITLQVDQLLGQVLGDCHDDDKSAGDSHLGSMGANNRY